METPSSKRALDTLLELQRARREDLTNSCVLADAEDHVAQVRCSEMLAELATRAERFAQRASELAALVGSDSSAPAVAAATARLDAARAALIESHQRIVAEWTAITQARLERARDLSQQVGWVCAATIALAGPAEAGDADPAQ
jgi:hypothetical protein